VPDLAAPGVVEAATDVDDVVADVGAVADVDVAAAEVLAVDVVVAVVVSGASGITGWASAAGNEPSLGTEAAPANSTTVASTAPSPVSINSLRLDNMDFDMSRPPDDTTDVSASREPP
jgi:hypothetical protein